jgi:hypothetical protein
MLMKLCAGVVGLALAFSATSVSASTMTYNFAGQITGVSGGDVGLLGLAFTGSFTASDTPSSDYSYPNYVGVSGMSGSVTYGTDTLEVDGSGIYYADQGVFGSYIFDTIPLVSGVSVPVSVILSLILLDPPTPVVPSAFPNPLDFASWYIQVYVIEGPIDIYNLRPSQTYTGQLSSLTVAAVPVPAGIPLLASGLGLLALLRSRKGPKAIAA